MSSSARLQELQTELAGVRRRLEELAGRLGAVRATTGPGDARQADATPPPEVPRAPTPLFDRVAGRALDDVELTFEVLDTEDPGREGR